MNLWNARHVYTVGLYLKMTQVHTLVSSLNNMAEGQAIQHQQEIKQEKSRKNGDCQRPELLLFSCTSLLIGNSWTVYHLHFSFLMIFCYICNRICKWYNASCGTLRALQQMYRELHFQWLTRQTNHSWVINVSHRLQWFYLEAIRVQFVVLGTRRVSGHPHQQGEILTNRTSLVIFSVLAQTRPFPMLC